MGKESACSAGDTGDLGSVPGLGRSPAGGHGNPARGSGLEDPHGERSLVGCTVCGVTKSLTRLTRPSAHAHWEPQAGAGLVPSCGNGGWGLPCVGCCAELLALSRHGAPVSASPRTGRCSCRRLTEEERDPTQFLCGYSVTPISLQH